MLRKSEGAEYDITQEQKRKYPWEMQQGSCWLPPAYTSREGLEECVNCLWNSAVRIYQILDVCRKFAIDDWQSSDMLIGSFCQQNAADIHDHED